MLTHEYQERYKKAYYINIKIALTRLLVHGLFIPYQSSL